MIGNHIENKPSGFNSLVAAEAITLYRHDKGAGVYRTESGNLH